MDFIPQDLYDVIFNRIPRATVDLVIRDKEKGILLTRRNIEPYKNLWHLPGGMVRFKETLSDAVERIAKKELHVEVKAIRNLGTCETMNDDLGEDKPRHSIGTVLELEIVSGTPQTTQETSEIGYFKKLPADIHPYQGPFIIQNRLLQ